MALAACATPVYRYVDLPVAPTAALASVEKDARAGGITAARVARHTDLVYARSRPDTRVVVRAVPRPGGTRVEISSETGNERVVDAVFPRVRGRTIRPVEDPDTVDRYTVDGNVDAGVALDGGAATWRVDAMARAGMRFDRAGLPGEDARPNWSLWGRAGVGAVAIGGSTGLRFEATLSLERIRALRLVPDTTLAVGPRHAVELSAAALAFADRAGLEGGVALRRAGWGSLWARAGWLGDGALVSGGVAVEGRAALVGAMAALIVGTIAATAIAFSQ